MDTDDVASAVSALRAGDVVALPTETVYGLAGAIDSESAIRKIFFVKGRPFLDPLIVHILDSSWIGRCAYVDGVEQQIDVLTDAFWPGPLTIILKKTSNISPLITSGMDTVALRCPLHEKFREVLRRIDTPLVAPSANPFGYLSPTTAQHVKNTLGDKVKIVLDGGKCTIGVESTILNLTSSIPSIVRPGAVTAKEIADVLGTIVMDYDPEMRSVTAPGQLPQHYSPHTRLSLLSSTDDITAVMNAHRNEHAAYICLKRPVVIDSPDVYWLSEDGDYKVVASALFDILQTLDSSGYDIIYCQCPENTGIGLAINDRLTRAAAKFNKA